MIRRTKILLIAGLLGLQANPAFCYKIDIGYTQLATEQGSNLHTGTDVPVSQTEAETDGVIGSPYQFFPDTDHAQFTGKTIVNVGNLNYTISAHATAVGGLFYGTNAMAYGITRIDAYEANNWLQADFLMFGSNQKPLTSSDRAGNHSWVGETGNAAYDTDILRRIDWVIETDDFIQLVGSKNNTTTNSNLLSGGYNVITVGKTDGLHSTGSKSIDTTYVAGRTRPEIVAPLNTTSSATPLIAASAAILIDLGHNNPGLSNGSSNNRTGDTIYNAENSETIKASLLAGADRVTVNTESTANITDYRTDPSNRSINGLDTRFGAGQINIYNSYHIIAAGEQNSQEDGSTGSIGNYGFDYDLEFGGSNGSNGSASYYFSTGSNPEIFYASLAWNIDITGGSRFFDGTAHLHDLDLFLYDVTGVQTLVTSSSSDLDNTENIWAGLSPERNYMLRVIPKSGQNSFSWDYAIAWRTASDYDGDMLPDSHDPDDDNDTLTDAEELILGSDPRDPDSDNDNLDDGSEVNIYGTSPVDSDTDNDGLPDGDEVSYGYDPTQSDKGQLAPYGAVDNVLNVADLLILYRIVSGTITPDPIESVLADMNSDGQRNVVDILLLQKILLNMQ